jgi:hypothetical protein
MCYSCEIGGDEQALRVWERVCKSQKVPQIWLVYHLVGSLYRKGAPRCFAAMLSHAYQDEEKEKEKGTNVRMNSLVESLRHCLFLDGDDYNVGLLACVAGYADPQPWRLITSSDNRTTFLRNFLVEQANCADRRSINPLSAAMHHPGDGADARRERDQRGAWLVPRLSVDAMNRYNDLGFTPLLQAAHEGFPLTLSALLARVPDVDVTARCILPANDKYTYLELDHLTRADARFDTLNAADLLSRALRKHLRKSGIVTEAFSQEIKFVDAELRAKVKWIESQAPETIGKTVANILFDAHLPGVLMMICFSYSAIPSTIAETVITETEAQHTTSAETGPPAKRRRLF